MTKSDKIEPNLKSVKVKGMAFTKTFQVKENKIKMRNILRAFFIYFLKVKITM